MPLPKVLLRRKLWLGVAVFLLLTCLYLYWPSELVHESERVHIPPVPTFDWVAIENVTSLAKCRNSVQGPQLIADELGYVCPFGRVLASGCCDKDHAVRFECQSCLEHGCCSVYEHCVSCCLHPEKRLLLKVLLTRNVHSFHPLYTSINNQFDLCLTKCRTSSQSVQHENTYRNPNTKFCYLPEAPPPHGAGAHRSQDKNRL